MSQRLIPGTDTVYIDESGTLVIQELSGATVYSFDPGAAINDATGLVDIVAQFNTLLATLRAGGIISY